MSILLAKKSEKACGRLYTCLEVEHARILALQEAFFAEAVIVLNASDIVSCSDAFMNAYDRKGYMY